MVDAQMVVGLGDPSELRGRSKSPNHHYHRRRPGRKRERAAPGSELRLCARNLSAPATVQPSLRAGHRSTARCPETRPHARLATLGARSSVKNLC